jgi:hypothetical protein
LYMRGPKIIFPRTKMSRGDSTSVEGSFDPSFYHNSGIEPEWFRYVHDT